MAPEDVTKENETALFYYLHWPAKSRQRRAYKYTVGDSVRISYLRHTFTRYYDHRWTGEVFTVDQRRKRDGIPVYKLRDYSGDILDGTFYEEELQKAAPLTNETVFKIDKVLKSRKRKGVEREHLVSWLYWPEKYNSWIPESQLTELRGK